MVLVATHWLLSALAYHFPSIEKMLKGQALPLVQEGRLNHANLKRGHITRKDLAATLRLDGHPGDVSQIRQAALETSGSISLSTHESEAHPATVQVLEVLVEPGIQTIRLQINRS